MNKYVWLSSQETLLAPTREEPHRRIEGPQVFLAPSAWFAKCSAKGGGGHPKLIPYSKLVDRYSLLVGSEGLASLHEQARKLDQPEDPSELPYRELQAFCKDMGVKAHGTREDLLERLSAVEEDSNE